MSETGAVITIKTKKSNAVQKWRNELVELSRKNRLVRGLHVVDYAPSGRSLCRRCGKHITKGALRVAKITFHPNRVCKYYHFDDAECLGLVLRGAALHSTRGLDKLSEVDQFKVSVAIVGANLVSVPEPVLPTLVGRLDMPQFANVMTTKYTRFRSFDFGLSEKEKYGENWNWRCMLATMLVCNTHETSMLKVTSKLFEAYPTPALLLTLMGDKDKKKEWMDWMEKCELRHVGKKLYYILNATKVLMDKHDGKVPASREELQIIPGVGRHVASIVMAWVHQKGEFGIDTHVNRILKRWGYVADGLNEIQIEENVKSRIPDEQLGAFSRSFVDHGRMFCGYTPNCKECPLRGCCPSAATYIDW